MMRTYLNTKTTVSTALMFGLLICLQTGCATLKPAADQDFQLAEQEAAPQCTVRLTSKFGQTRVETIDLTEPTTVQMLLEQTKATKDYRTMDINIFRPAKIPGQMIVLPVKYDPGNNHAMEECNYAIHAGDVLTIQPEKNSALDKFVSTVFGTQ